MYATAVNPLVLNLGELVGLVDSIGIPATGILTSIPVVGEGLPLMLSNTTIKYGVTAAGVAQGVIMTVFNGIFEWLATWLTDIENHATDERYEFSYIIKYSIFQFFNSCVHGSTSYRLQRGDCIGSWTHLLRPAFPVLPSTSPTFSLVSYFPQIYVAFIKVPVHKYIFQLDVMCSGPEGSCIAELKSQLIIILAMKITIDNVKELLPSPNQLIIFAKRKVIAPCNRCCGKKSKKKKRKKAQIVPEDDEPEQSPEAELMVDRWTRLTVKRPKTGLKALFDPKLRKQAKKERAEANLATKREKAATKAARDEERKRAKVLKAEQKDASAAAKSAAKAAKADAKAAKAAAKSAGDDEPAGDAALAGNGPVDAKAAAKAAKEEVKAGDTAPAGDGPVDKKSAAAAAKAEKKAAAAAAKAEKKAGAAAAKEAKAAAKASAKAAKADDDFAHATNTEASGESDATDSDSEPESDSEVSSTWEMIPRRGHGTGLREASGDDDEGVEMAEPAANGGEGDADAAGEDTPFVAPSADATGDSKADKKLAAQKAKLVQAEAKAAIKAVRALLCLPFLVPAFSTHDLLLTRVAKLRRACLRAACFLMPSIASPQAALQAKKDKAEAKKVAKAAKVKAKKVKQMAAAKEKAKKQAAKEKAKEHKAKEKARMKKGKKKPKKKKRRDSENSDVGSEDDALLGEEGHESAEEDSDDDFDEKAVKVKFPWQLPEVRRMKGLLYERQRPAYPGRYDGGKAISPVTYWEMRVTTAEEALEPLSKDERRQATPLLKALRTAQNELEMAKAQEVIELEQLEEELALDPYDAEERMKDYGEMVIMYGFVVLFAVACPLGALLGFVGTYLELKVDSVKLVFAVRRPSPMDAKDIGAWLFVLKTLTYLGIFFNLFLLFYTGDLLVKYTSNVLVKWLIFFAVEHVFIITQLVIDKGVPDEPPDVALQSRRQQNIRRRLVEDIKLMEDNTLEPADAIANLMSNPRFMRRMPLGAAQWNKLHPDLHPI